MNDKEFTQLLEFLGFSWQGYRKVRKGVNKRVCRHMQSLGYRSLREYLEQLGRSAKDKSQCELAMTVPLSRFFRDQRLWEAFENRILPELIAAGKGKVRVWSAGCACGEEVYSLKILWDQMSRSTGTIPVLDITATDLNPLHLERAEAGVYPASSLREVPEEIKATGFEVEPGGKRFKVKPDLRAGIVWRVHDFLSGPPESGFNLVLVRNNLLTYYQKARIRPALADIVNAIAAGGYLVVGSREKLPCPFSALQACSSLPFAFRKAA
jgi:chemotaxis protein methyltransferase CheR